MAAAAAIGERHGVNAFTRFESEGPVRFKN